MSKLICADSQILIWGVKKQAIESQKNMIDIASNFIEWATKQDMIFLVPTPMLAELLSPVPPSEHQIVRELIDKRFHVAPFDELASTKCSELIHTCLTKEELVEYRASNSIPKSKMKFDCMIAATAIVRRAMCIYSNDKGLEKFSCGQIKVLPLPIIPIQKELYE